LAFYRRFVVRQSEDAAAVSELEGVSQQVKRVVGELQELNRSAKFLLLADRQVQQELGIGPEQAKQLQSAIAEVEAAQRKFGEKLTQLDAASIESMEK